MGASKPRPLPIRWLSAARWYTVNLLGWIRQRGTGPQGGKVVHVDIRRNHWHRYLHILLHFLQLQGYRVELRHRWRFLGDWASSDLFRRLRGIRLVLRGPRGREGLVITDRKGAAGALVITADYFSLPGERAADYRVPMPMADSAYLLGVHEHRPMVAAPRLRAAFFFGNMDRKAYARSEALALFGCMDRNRFLDTIRQGRPDRVLEPAGLEEIAERGGRDIVLLNRVRQYIAPKDLPGVLARFDFFLAPSGVVMPLCHNLVEALFAGCIPILQHAHLMDPPLIDGVHCLSFRDEAGLLAALDRASALDEERIQAMRAEVRRYYEAHLTPRAVVGRLEALGSGTVRLNGEGASVAELGRKLAAAGYRGGLPLP